MIHQLIAWLIDTILAMGYPGIILLMAIESSVLPLPSELVIPPAGYLVAKGHMNGWLVVLCGTFGSIVGALVNYALALAIGLPALRRYGRYVLISERSLDRTERYFQRHGEISTMVGRLLPVIRHLISIPAGISRMPLGRFVVFTAIGAGIWCGVLAYIGWLLGTHEAALQQTAVHDYTSRALMYLLPAVVLLVAGYIIWHRRRSRRSA